LYFFIFLRAPALNSIYFVPEWSAVWGNFWEEFGRIAGLCKGSVVSGTPKIWGTGLWGFAAARLMQGNGYMNTESTFFMKSSGAARRLLPPFTVFYVTFCRLSELGLTHKYE
jgi:hypothetical protein